MSVSENKALYRRYLEILNSRKLDALDEVIAFDFVGHDLPHGVHAGREGLKQYRLMVDGAFPDFEAVLQDIVAEDDRVAARVKIHGHHRGEFGGVPATGRYVRTELFEIVRIAHGKIAERWMMRDRLGEMLQLGITPATVH